MENISIEAKCLECKIIVPASILQNNIVEYEGNYYIIWCDDCTIKKNAERRAFEEANKPNIKNDHGYSCESWCACRYNEKWIV